MFLIGLTGGIAAGKSTVASHWQSLGGVQIDADEIARQVVAPGTPGLAKVAAQFGSSVLNSDGSLNRAALGALVFNDPDARKKLEGILHPLVKAEAKRLVALQPNEAIVIYNVPLLVEAGVDLDFDRVVTVEAPAEDQVARMLASRGMTAEDALSRIQAQASPAQRANRADYILSSNQPLNLMLKDAGKLWLQFEREAAAKLKSESFEHVSASAKLKSEGTN